MLFVSWQFHFCTRVSSCCSDGIAKGERLTSAHSSTYRPSWWGDSGRALSTVVRHIMSTAIRHFVSTIIRHVMSTVLCHIMYTVIICRITYHHMSHYVYQQKQRTRGTGAGLLFVFFPPFVQSAVPCPGNGATHGYDVSFHNKLK